MGLCKGSTKVIDTTAKDLKPLRAGAIDYLSGKTAPQAGNGGYQNGAGGAQPPGFWGLPQINQSGVPAGGTATVGNNAGGPMVEPVSRAAGDYWQSTMPIQSGATPTGMDRITAPTMYAGANPNVQYAGNAAPVTAGVADMIASPDRAGVRDVGIGAQGNAMWDMIMKNMTQGGGLGNVGTSSVDALGSETSGFFKNMMNQYQPAFTQGRADALAQAKEGMGNLTGSGAGNVLGGAMNRSLGQEQATLAELAKWGIGEENKRQLELAGINTQRDIANLGTNMNAGISMAGMGLDAARSNQGADMNFMDLMSKIGMANQGEQGRAAGQQGQMDLATTLQNQNLLQQILSQSSAQGVDLSKFNAGQGNQMGAHNSQQFLQMLMGMLGQNNTVVQQNPSALSSVVNAGVQLGSAYLGGR